MVRGQAELFILKIGNAKALVRDKRQKVYSRALFVSTHLKLNQPKQGERVGPKQLLVMEKEDSKKITQIVGDEQIKRALEMGLCVVRVTYDNEHGPITLVSKEKLSNSDYIFFVESLGISAKEYNIRGEIKNK